jgi:hypothetical protein
VSEAGPAPQPTVSSTKRKAKGRPHAKVLGAGVLTLEACLEPAPMASKPTTDERRDLVKVPITSLYTRLPCCTGH